MAWTTPRTWVTGEVVTASIGNTHWRDNLSYLKGDAGQIDINDVIESRYSSSFPNNQMQVGTLTPAGYPALGFLSDIRGASGTNQFANTLSGSKGFGIYWDGSTMYWAVAANTTVGTLFASPQAVMTLDATGLLKAAGMAVHRSPYGNLRHIEAGATGFTSVGADVDVAVSFTDAFSSAPAITGTLSDVGGGGADLKVLSVSTTGATFRARNVGAVAGTIYWIAEGVD